MGMIKDPEATKLRYWHWVHRASLVADLCIRGGWTPADRRNYCSLDMRWYHIRRQH